MLGMPVLKLVAQTDKTISFPMLALIERRRLNGRFTEEAKNVRMISHL